MRTVGESKGQIETWRDLEVWQVVHGLVLKEVVKRIARAVNGYPREDSDLERKSQLGKLSRRHLSHR